MSYPSNDAMVAEQVALWVAGAPVDLPLIQPADVSRVLQLLDAHCLLGRAVESGLVDIAGSRLGNLIVGRQAAIEALVEEQRAAVKEIEFRAGPNSVAVLKGIVTYGHTGHAGSLRTGDVDVVVAADIDVAALLGDLGYRQTRGPFMHERGEFIRGSVEIDVHDHYPVVGRPPGLSRSEIQRRSFTALGEGRRGVLSSEMLLRTARPAFAPRLDGLPIIAPEAQVVILAVHSFMNYVNAWSISHREKVWVRLGELLDIELLTRQADFSHGGFAQLAADVGAEDAIAFVRHVGRILLGRELLPGSWSDQNSLPPRAIWWDTWIETPPALAMLVQTDWFDVDGLVGLVGPRLLDREVPVEVDPATPARGVLSTSAAAPALSCRLHWSPAPALEVAVASIDRDEPLRLRIDGGSWAVEWSRVPDQAQGSFSGNVRGEVSAQAGRVAMQALIPSSTSTRAFVGAAVAGAGRTAEATVVAVEWEPLA